MRTYEQLRSARSTEQGGQVYRNIETGERRYVTGREAGRGGFQEFRHHVRPQQNEDTELLSHAHRASWERGSAGARYDRGQNAPSIDDQEAMHDTGAAVQTIGPGVVMRRLPR